MDYTTIKFHHGNRRRRPPSIPGCRHIQEDGRLPWAQSAPESHPHQPLLKPAFPSPSSQQSVLSSLIHGAKTLYDQDSLAQEREFFTTFFKNNGYSHQQIRRSMQMAKESAKNKDKPTATAYILYTTNTYGRLSRLLATHNIKSFALPPRKISSFLPPVKDALGLKHRAYTRSCVNVAKFI